jgi:hypothetical protein
VVQICNLRNYESRKSVKRYRLTIMRTKKTSISQIHHLICFLLCHPVRNSSKIVIATEKILRERQFHTSRPCFSRIRLLFHLHLGQFLTLQTLRFAWFHLHLVLTTTSRVKSGDDWRRSAVPHRRPSHVTSSRRRSPRGLKLPKDLVQSKRVGYGFYRTDGIVFRHRHN